MERCVEVFRDQDDIPWHSEYSDHQTNGNEANMAHIAYSHDVFMLRRGR